MGEAIEYEVEHVAELVVIAAAVNVVSHVLGDARKVALGEQLLHAIVHFFGIGLGVPVGDALASEALNVVRQRVESEIRDIGWELRAGEHFE